MYYPTLEQVKDLTGEDGNLVPVYREVQADLETPVSAYLKIERGPYSFLLESVEGGERLGRYSFLGTEPYRVLKTGPGQPVGAEDPLVHIGNELARFKPVPVEGLPRFLGGAVGYLGFECVRYFEPRVRMAANDRLGLPESVFMFIDTLLIFDHLKHRIQVVSHVQLDGDVEESYRKAVERIDRLVERLEGPLTVPAYATTAPGAGDYTANVTQERYHQMVQKAREYIIAGDIIQVVPSQRLMRPTSAAPFAIYRSLRAINPSPYMYYLHLDDFDIVGASPELLVRVEEGVVDIHPIAGTRPRGGTNAEDLALEEELRHDEKERAEHTMLLDLGRNDIGRVSSPGTVRVTQMMDVERYSHVMHLVSHVTGELAPGLTAYDALRSCFPAGTVSGAPKIRAIEIIADLEPERRGPYSGAIGYFSLSGNMDTAIAIRTMVVKDGVAHLQAGGGVVYDSDPDREYQETLQKMGALLRAIDNAEGSA
jgi:anthranilate synthase component 1